MWKRSRLEITLAVLGIIHSGVCNTTHIMNQTGISWENFQEVLKTLVPQGLVHIEEPERKGRRRDKRITKIYKVTEKGVGVLRYFKDAEEFQLLEVPDFNRSIILPA